MAEIADLVCLRKFTKTWRKNMTQSDPCVIVPYKDKKDYVKVTFSPDLHRFQLSSLDEDFVSLLTKRVYDVAGCCSLKVWFNGIRLPIDNFKSYVDLYFPKSKPPESVDESTMSEKYG
jgi:DNA topoisomerase II